MTRTAILFLLLLGVPVWAQAPLIPPGDKEAVLRIEADGPTAFVTALAFSPDGKQLYAGGYDKVVRVWTLNEKSGRFEASSSAYRVPIGPGLHGAIGAIAVSPDGALLAVAGSGLVRDAAGFARPGVILPKIGGLTAEMRRDQGTIYLFDLKTGAVRPLRGHTGPVLSLAFAPALKGKPPLLVSVARDSGDVAAGGVRLWDAGRGLELGELKGLPDPGDQRVGLGAWFAGLPEPQLRVALAWPGKDINQAGTLLIWDAERNKIPAWKATDGSFNNVLTLGAEPDRPGTALVLTGSFHQSKGYVQGWTVAPDQGPKMDAARSLAIPPRAGDFFLPRALAVFPSKSGGGSDRAAVVIRVPRPTGGDEYQMRIIRLDAAGFKDEHSPLSLWRGGSYQPTVAVAPATRFLAVAGDPSHAIQVLAIDQLLAGAGVQPQVLAPAGSAMRHVSLVAKGKARGLLLNEQPGLPGREPVDGDLIFDLTDRVLTGDGTGWRIDAPRPDGTDLKELLKKVRLGPRQTVTAAALLPAGKPSPFGSPILAVASEELGEVLIALYNATTGEQLRQLTGHVNRIHSLAFSADGRLLASVGEDQLTCVWSLTDLDGVLGRQGAIRGLVVQDAENNQGVAIAQIDAASLSEVNREALRKIKAQAGDRVEGLVVKGRLLPLASALAFYEAILQTAPGKGVTLRLRQREAPPVDVVLVVGQGIDERKPLLSLFLTRGQGAQRRWIGWNPVGPYDCSDRDAEKLLGWHENTGKPEAPVRFATAAEYRDKNHKPNILRYLIEQGNAGQAIEAWEKERRAQLPPPKMTPWVREGERVADADARGRTLLRRPRGSLMLTLHDLPRGTVDSVSWQLDGRPAGQLKPETEREWSADLAGVAWKRGEEHQLDVVLHVRVPEPQSYPRRLTVVYEPFYPVVKAAGQPALAVREADYKVTVEVTPSPDRPAKVRLIHTTKAGQKTAEKEITRLEKITWPMTLERGVNRIEVQAFNKDAPDERDPAGRDRLSLEVAYDAVRPQVSLSTVQWLPDGPEIRIDSTRPDQPIIVSSSRVRIVGEIEAIEELKQARWLLNKQTGELALQGKKAAIRQELTIDPPGQPQRVRFLAKTAKSEEAERSVLLEFRPQLPELRVTAPPAEGPPLVEGKDAPTIRVQGQLKWPIDRYPFQAEVLVNGKPIGKPVAFDIKGETISLEVPIQARGNQLQVRLNNDWQKEPITTPAGHVQYLRPPKIVAVPKPQKTERPFIDLVLRAETSKDLPPTRVEIAGHELSGEAFRPVKVREEDERITWEITARDVSLQEGKNALMVRVGNEDGWGLQPATVEVELSKPPPPRAEITVLDPLQDTNSAFPRTRVHFTVGSVSPLKKVELLRGDNVAYTRPGLAALKKNERGLYEVDESPLLDLELGANVLRVTAINDGGEQVTAPVVINYRPQPVLVVMDRLVDPNNQVISLQGLASGGRLPQAVQQGQFRLQGRVVWDPSNDQRLAAVKQVLICVNGHMQRPVELRPPVDKVRERTFEAPVVLTRSENVLTVGLSNMAHDANSRRECLITCAHPVAGQRRQAHILLININKVDENQALSRVLLALRATPELKDRDRCTMEGFNDGGRLYGPLVGENAVPEKIYPELIRLGRNLRLRAEAGHNQDVVFIYYECGERVTAQTHAFRTFDSASDPELKWSGIPCDHLRGFFADYLGSLVLLLDVNRDAGATGASALAGDQVAHWPTDPNVSVLRYAWRGPPKERGEDSRLILDLAQMWPKARQWKDVLTQIGERFTPLSRSPSKSLKYGDRLTLDEYVATGLRGLPLRPK